MENININGTESKTDKPSIETLSTINELDKEFLEFTKRPDLDANPDATFKWLDDWTEKRFGLKGERGSVWQKDRTAYSTPGEYARALTGLLNRGYEAIATPEYNALIAAEKANNRDEIIKLGNISLEKREAYEDAYGLPIGTHMVKKTDEEIDKEIKEYTAKVKSQNFAAHFLSFADDFTPQEKDIVYASLRYGDGLPAEKEADYLAVWRDNPEKAARLDYLIKLSRKNEYAWMRDNLWHPLATGTMNIYYGMGDELYDFAEFQSLISNMKDIVKGDGERRMWNDEERKLYHDLEARKATKQMDLNRRGLGNSALFQTFTSAADVGVTNPRAHVDEICARRMAREALPREEQLKRRKEQLMLRIATSHQPYDDYDPVSNAISGAIGSVPYMAVAAIPYAGIAINTLAQFGNVRNDIILNGGNPDDAAAAQLLLAMGWSAIEKQQFLTFAKPLTGLQKKAILERIAQTAWKNGKLSALGSAIRQGAPELIAKTFAECVEEGLQGAVEGGTKQWWMPEEKGGGDWTKAVSAALTQGAKDFIDSIGTMGIISLVGGGLNQTQARRNALSVESLMDYAGKKMQVMNIMTGRVKEMADNKDAPANAQKMLNEITQIWQAHKGNAVAALDEMREKYSLTDAQARTVGDYLDLESTLLNIARTSKTDEEANAIAAFAGGAYRVGQTTGMGDTAYDVTDLFRMISPNITVEDIEVDDKTKAPVASPAVENLRQERDAALKRIEEAKVGSQRKAAERELKRVNKKLKAAEANENAVSYPKMTMRRVTIPVGKNGETRSFVIREDNEAPDIHSAGYAQSAADAVKGGEGLKAGEKVSLQEFKALGLADKLKIAVTQEQYMAMSNEERVAYVSHFGLGGSGNFALLDNTGKEIFNSNAIVSIFRGKVGNPGARIGGNWSLAHEYTHAVVRFLRDIGAIDEGTVDLMRRLFGEPTSDNELWNEEAMANGFAEFLRGEFDFRRLTAEERREAMGFFERVWDIIKDFFRRIFGKEIDEPPVVASIRKEAERAVFNALRNGDLSGLDQYAGIEFEEEKREEGKGKREEIAEDAREATSKPSKEKATNETPKSKERAPEASTPSNTAKDAPKEPAKAETAATTTATTDVAAVVEQIENPIATAANLPARTNTKMTIFTPGYEMEIECEMMWVPLNELAESTDDREVQMRDRSRRATDEQVRTKTRKGVFQPLALFPGKKSDDGAPIVGGGMKIISGHGRKRMLEQLASEGRFNEYLSAINAEAQRQGVPSAPEGMKNPVLVLRVTGGLDKKSDLNRFAELSNRWGGLERSGAELAESDARKITDALLRLYNPDSSGNLLAASNRQFMAAFLKEVGATGLTNADGTPTPEAALRVQRALMTAIFGNDEKIRAIIQNLLEKSGELSLGNLQNALMRSAGKLLAMKRAKGSFDIVNDVREAAYHYIAWRSAQQKQKSLSFADYLSEQDMFAEVATPMQAALAKLLEVGRFGTVLDEYSKLVAQEAVDAQGAFDFAEKRTPLQLLGFAERNTLAAEETPVTPDPESAKAAEPVQTPPAVSEEESGDRGQELGVSADPSVLTPNPSLTTAQAVITQPEPETFTPAPLVRGTATLPGPGAEGIKAHQVNANGEPTTRVKTLPAGAWNLLRAPYDVRRPPKASAQDKAGRGLKISNPPPANWNGIFPHFQGNKTEMADRTSQAIRANMTKAEREHYTTVVDYFGGGGCWGLFHTLANFPNVKTLVINEFDPDRLGKIRLLQEIDGELADIAYKLLDERYEEIRAAAKDSSSPSTIANIVESQFKRVYTDPTERAAIQAFVDCAHTLLATSKDAQGNPINDTRLGIHRAIDTLREDGRKAKEAADAFKAREGATIRYVSGDAVANADTLPHGDDVMAIADPPYYLTADYQQNTILGLEKVPDNWSYRATQEFLHKLVDSGDGLVYTDEAWWFKEAYNPDQQEDLFGGGSTFAKEQEILLDIINTLDHFDVAGRVVGRQEVLGVHHGHKINARTENGENGNAVRPDTIDNAGGGRSAGSPVLGVAAEPQGQSGRDGADSGARGLNGERASVIASGRRALAREVIIQDIAASIESAATEIAQGAAVDIDAVSRLARFSVRQVREERMAEYAQFVSKNAKSWLRNAAKRLDERMKDAGYTEKVWHGTEGEDFNVFKFSAGSHEVPAAYFSYNQSTAENYAAWRSMDAFDTLAESGVESAESAVKPNIRGFYINPGKVLDIDETKKAIPFDEFKKILADAYNDGYNTVRVKGAFDDQGFRLGENDDFAGFHVIDTEDEDGGRTDILIVMQQHGDNAQARIKAADAVTFDEDGLPIPLEMRVDQSMSDIRFSVQMGKKAREEARRMIEKYRPGLHGFVTNVNGVLMPQDDAAIESIAAFETPKERKAALLWFCKYAIRLPEDAPKVTEAIKTAERAKVDPMQYDRPGDILEKFSEFRPKEPPINPDTVPELTDKRDMGSGVTTYLVQDDKAGQLAMRKIINTHWGKDANPWCLLQGDGYGNLSDGSNGGYDAWHYWQHYNALPKRVAFQNGKLLAFMATDGHSGGIMADEDVKEQWWDRADQSHDGIPTKRVTKSESEYGASTTTETIELMQNGTEVTTGKKRESFAPDGTRTIEEWGANGDPEGYERRTRHPSGMHENTFATKKHDATYFSTVTNNILEIHTLRLSDSITKEITWEHDNYTNYHLQTNYKPNTKNSVYILYKYERGAFRETDVEYTSETVNAWRDSAEAALRRGEAMPPLPGTESASTTPRWSVAAIRDVEPMSNAEIKRALKMFGKAKRFLDIAYITPNGMYLDYDTMGEHWEISQAFTKKHKIQAERLREDDGDRTPEIAAAIKGGLVRVTQMPVKISTRQPTSLGVEIGRTPDENTIANIVDYFRYGVNAYDEVSNLIIEYWDENKTWNRSYTVNQIEKIAADLKTFAKTGEMPEERASLVAEFHSRFSVTSAGAYDGNWSPMDFYKERREWERRRILSAINSDNRKREEYDLMRSTPLKTYFEGVSGVTPVKLEVRRIESQATMQSEYTRNLSEFMQSYASTQRLGTLLMRDSELEDGTRLADDFALEGGKLTLKYGSGIGHDAIKTIARYYWDAADVRKLRKMNGFDSLGNIVGRLPFSFLKSIVSKSDVSREYVDITHIAEVRDLVEAMREKQKKDELNNVKPGNARKAPVYDVLGEEAVSCGDYRALRDFNDALWSEITNDIKRNGDKAIERIIAQIRQGDLFGEDSTRDVYIYALAKYGRYGKYEAAAMNAANEFVEKFLTDEKIEALKAKLPTHGDVIIFYPQHETGRNAIPKTLARKLRLAIRRYAECKPIVITSDAHRYGLSAEERANRVVKVAPIDGRDIRLVRKTVPIIVDDVMSLGGTIASCAYAIRDAKMAFSKIKPEVLVLGHDPAYGTKLTSSTPLTTLGVNDIITERKFKNEYGYSADRLTLQEARAHIVPADKIGHGGMVSPVVGSRTVRHGDEQQTLGRRGGGDASGRGWIQGSLLRDGMVPGERERGAEGEWTGASYGNAAQARYPNLGGGSSGISAAVNERHHVRRGRTPRNIDDTLTSYVAAQIMGGTDVTIEDMRKIVSSASSSTRAADILERAKTLANDNRAKAVAKAASSAAELSHRLGDMLETDRLNKALSDAVTMGAKAANPETGRKLQQAIERKRMRDLQCAEGFTAAEIMAELPIDLGEAVLAAAERERTPEELAKLEEARKQREEERKKKLETEEGAEELADEEAPMREPSEAEKKAVDDLLDRARIRDDLQREEEERKRAEKAKRDATEAEGSESGDNNADGGGDTTDGTTLLPEDTVRRIAPVFESADVFSWFIIELTSDKTLEKHPELPSTGEMWKSPVAVRELKKTAADILRRLAKDTLGSPSINYARNLVDRAINELESDLETKSFNSVRRKIARIYTMIWDNAHRITKNELMKELEKTVSKLTQKGRFSYTQEEMERDIPAKIERWAKWVLKYAKMGEETLVKEIARLEQLVSANPASEDGKMPTPIELAEAADRLAVAKVYGHLKGKSIGQMRDLIDQIAAKLDGERQAFELRRAKIEEANKTIVDALVNALTQGKANRRNKAKAKGIIDRAMESMISSIDQQMVDLVRFCTDPELRKKALEAIDELTILINEGGNRYRNTLATAQEEIHDGLKACYGDAAKGIRHLHEELPEEIAAQFFRQSSDQKRTYGHLLQLYASCLQRDYAENVRKHGRDKEIEAMEAALTAQDKMFHTWAINWYKHNRQALSDAVEEVTGLPVISPDELYVPVRVETEPSGIPAEVVAWSPIPSALNRRVRHGLDFDENAHFLTMLNDQAKTRAQTIGYAMTGIILRDTIASRDVQTAARRNASPSDLNAVITHLRDILAQDAGREKSLLESLNVLRKWAARFNIAWNPSSALAQPASIPVWANVLLDGKAWGAMSVLKAMATAGTEEGRAAIAELRASDGYRARYALGWSEEVANVYANPNEPKFLSKLGAAYDKGMILSQFTDAACSLWIAQGFYRHATDVFVRRGETIEEAKRKALALTWAAVEQTQQSGRIENLSALQRGRGKNIINAILQFKTAQVLQNSYIIRAIRDVRAGVPGAKGRLARAMFISTVWVPGYLALKGALWALIMGVKPEPDDEDEMPLWFREMMYSAVDGMAAPLFVTSAMAEAPLRKMLDLKSYDGKSGIAAIDTWQKLGNDIYRLMSDPIMLEEELTTEKIIDDIWKVIGDVSAPIRHAKRAYNNWSEE